MNRLVGAWVLVIALAGCADSATEPVPGVFTGADDSGNAASFQLSVHVDESLRITTIGYAIECPGPEEGVGYGQSAFGRLRIDAEGQVTGDAGGAAVDEDAIDFRYVDGRKGFELDGFLELNGRFGDDGTQVSGSWTVPDGMTTVIVTPNGGGSETRRPVGCSGDWSGERDDAFP